MTPAAYLTKKDRALAKVIARAKLERLAPQKDYFRFLAEAIISQQLSDKAATTIVKRFVALFPRKQFPSPQDVLKIPAAKLRRAGMSWSKTDFLKDLAKHVKEKRLDFHKFPRWTDEEVIAHLITVHGIGRWTAEMFLIFSLGRPDVFSPGDQGLKNAIRKLYKLRKEPTAKQLKTISDTWRPHRSLACRYLWKSLEVKADK